MAQSTPPPPAYVPPAASIKKYDNTQASDVNLKTYRYMLAVDKSGSMGTEDVKMDDGKSVSRWEAMKESVMAFAQTIQSLQGHNTIEFTFFDRSYEWKTIPVDELGKKLNDTLPRGGTALADVLQSAFDKFFAKAPALQPTIILVITDGDPDDRDAVMQTVAKASQQLQACGGQDSDLGITVLQIGNDPSVGKFLWALDNQIKDLYNAPFDIVTTVNESHVAAVGFKQALLNAIIA